MIISKCILRGVPSYMCFNNYKNSNNHEGCCLHLNDGTFLRKKNMKESRFILLHKNNFKHAKIALGNNQTFNNTRQMFQTILALLYVITNFHTHSFAVNGCTLCITFEEEVLCYYFVACVITCFSSWAACDTAITRSTISWTAGADGYCKAAVFVAVTEAFRQSQR